MAYWNQFTYQEIQSMQGIERGDYHPEQYEQYEYCISSDECDGDDDCLTDEEQEASEQEILAMRQIIKEMYSAEAKKIINEKHKDLIEYLNTRNS